MADAPPSQDGTNASQRDLEARRRSLEEAELAAREEEVAIKRLRQANERKQLEATTAGSGIIELNVGGRVFATSKETLLLSGSPYFSRLLEEADDGLQVRGAQRDAAGRIFLDRSPDVFGQLLEYLRGSLDLDRMNNDARHKLLQEARFYQMQPLVNELENPPPPRDRGYDEECLIEEVAKEQRQAKDLLQALREERRDCSNEADAALIALYGKGGRQFDIDFAEAKPPYTKGAFLFDRLAQLGRATRAKNEVRVTESIQEFLQRLTEYGGSLLRDLIQIEHLVVAGGAVLRAMGVIGDPGDFDEDGSADVDLFVVAPDDQAAKRVYDNVLQLIKDHRADAEEEEQEEFESESFPYDDRDVVHHRQLLVTRSPHSITFSLGFPNRNLQLILRRYSCVAEILLAFDLDCCKVAFDGRRVLASPAAKRSIETGINVVNPYVATPRYETRLIKYARHGFRVAVPGLDMRRVKPEYRGGHIYTLLEGGVLKMVEVNYSTLKDSQVRPASIQGLSKLIVLSGAFDLSFFDRQELDDASLGLGGDPRHAIRMLPRQLGMGLDDNPSCNYLIDFEKLRNRYLGAWELETPPNRPPIGLMQWVDDVGGTMNLADSVGGPLLPFNSKKWKPAHLYRHIRSLPKVSTGKNLVCFDYIEDVTTEGPLQAPHVQDASRQFPNGTFGDERDSLSRFIAFPRSSGPNGDSPWGRLPAHKWTSDAYDDNIAEQP